MAKTLLFFDTETTGNEPKDYLCQIAYKIGDQQNEALFKPPIPIAFEAMAVHHITTKAVADKPAFKGSPEWKTIKDHFADENTIVIAHNAPFDIMILKKEEIEPKHFICTLRIAKYLDPEEKIPSYRLQYLRYFLDIEIEASAHDALGDVLVLEKLFERLLKKMTDLCDGDTEKAIETMAEISAKPSLIKTFKFGKYNGKTIAEIAKNDPGYLDWLLAQKLPNAAVEEDWIFTLKHYLGK